MSQLLWALTRRAVLTALVVIPLAWLALRLVPLPPALLAPPRPSLEFVDRHGLTLRETRVDAQFAREVSFDEIPPVIVHAILAAEDKRFFSHHGVDPLAITRAGWAGLRRGRLTSGASTITQQLVKIAAPRRRTLRAKLVEAATALRVEQCWSKERILAAYLNRLDFGNLNAGIGAAANYYFGKPLADLSDAEAALLAGLPRNPRKLNPHRSRAAAEKRQQTVLHRMHGNGWLSAGPLERARGEKLRLQPPRRLFRTPHFIDMALREIGSGTGPTIGTTIDIHLNSTVEEIVRGHLAGLRGQNVRNGAAVVIENATGDVLAMVGSEDYFAPGAGQVNGAWAPRQAGSTLKPFTYLLALEGESGCGTPAADRRNCGKDAAATFFTPASVIADVPAVFATATGIYEPQNFHRRCHGPVRMRHALANSLNIPAVKVLASIGGAPVLHARLEKWGITTLKRSAESYGLGLTLGNGEVRLVELTNAYAALARLGDWRPYRLLIGSGGRRETGRGFSTSLRFARNDSAAEAWLIADMLRDNAARTPAFGADSALRFDFPVACKTGTSTDFRDNWALGYTPEFTVGVWVGNFDGSPMREVSGVSGAAPIMHAIFERLRKQYGTSWYATLPEIVERAVHPISGKLLVKPRADAVREKFQSDRLPPRETAADYDAAGRVRLGAEYRDWLNSAENAFGAAVVTAEPSRILRVLGPLPGTHFIVDPDIPSSRLVPLEAEGPTAIRWQSESLSLRNADGRMHAVAEEGEHRITAVDPATGARSETWIRVKSL